MSDLEGWGKHVLLELEKNDEAHGKIYEKLERIQVDIAGLKVKASVWGLLGGAIPSVVAIIFWIMKAT